MKTTTLLFLAVVFSCPCSVARAQQEEIKENSHVEEYHRRNLYRSYHLTNQLIERSVGPNKERAIKDGVIMAFTYFVLRSRSLIDADKAIEHHVKEMFEKSNIDRAIIEDPLDWQDKEVSSALFTDLILEENEYRELAREFSKRYGR
ncbi:hypothetical protein ACFQY0_20800 [Haloferula chungangensis]|uniref:Uncharacterized protein n=1 Tax=Haloferula chungangensis TaxID=1048331 RepID=A0ABW2LFS3_9BACT